MLESLPLFERLGAFYLGHRFDQQEERQTTETVLYDSADLVTHAMIVGMTGSGKTGLGISLLEEAAIDGVPTIIIDPKGDMANLCLTFPDLQADDFEPWIDAEEARKRNLTTKQLAEETAGNWRDGLARYGQDADRIRRLREASPIRIFTPGSDAGESIAVLSSFAAPPEAIRWNQDAFHERLDVAVTSLLTLIGLPADPVRSRDHILLTTIVGALWNQGRDLDLPTLVQQVQNPPVETIGVIDLETFYPSKERFDLALAINNLLAAPTFANWLSGTAMKIGDLLYDAQGRPQHCVFSIAHLGDTQRMFFVSLLLNEVLTWIRSCDGTSSLRALLYIDEVFGYMPPVAEPPSKKILLTLLKQARAFGLGVVLSTQNPADLDYKGLSNIGSWFIGRLQTERDKQRVLDGLAGLRQDASGWNRETLSKTITGLNKRVFLLHNVHEAVPVLFHTRWAMSYLAGPLTRDQIRTLAPKPPSGTDTLTPSRPNQRNVAAPTPESMVDASTQPPVLSDEIPQYVIQFNRHPGQTRGSSGQLESAAASLLSPAVFGLVSVDYVLSRKGLSAHEQFVCLAFTDDSPMGIDWSGALRLETGDLSLQDPAEGMHQFCGLPSSLARKDNYRSWQKQLEQHLYRVARFPLFYSEILQAYARPEESERDFRVRLLTHAAEQRDQQITKLREEYASKVERLEERVHRAQRTLERESAQASNATMQTAISIGATLLGAVLGRKRVSSRSIGRATTAARGFGRVGQQRADVQRAEEDLRRCQHELHAIEKELDEQVKQLRSRMNPLSEELSVVQLKPRRSDIDVKLFGLGWVLPKSETWPIVRDLS